MIESSLIAFVSEHFFTHFGQYLDKNLADDSFRMRQDWVKCQTSDISNITK